MEAAVRSALQRSNRNVIEVEGSGVPADILSDSWNDWVFITSIRHPMDRIDSFLRNVQGYKHCSLLNRGNTTKRAECYSRLLMSRQHLLDKCHDSIFKCLSNYLVRMFSGRELEWTSDEQMLRLAKINFYRFSCVILQEEWAQTQTCLGDRLGLYIYPDQAYNVNGAIHVSTNVSTALDATMNGNSSDDKQLLTNQDYDMLLSLNQVDLEFYEWAKQQILSSV